jgi:hypothetical protein
MPDLKTRYFTALHVFSQLIRLLTNSKAQRVIRIKGGDQGIGFAMVVTSITSPEIKVVDNVTHLVVEVEVVVVVVVVVVAVEEVVTSVGDEVCVIYY